MGVRFRDRKKLLEAKAQGIRYPLYPEREWPGVFVTLQNIGTTKMGSAIERHERHWRRRNKVKRRNQTPLVGTLYAIREALIEVGLSSIEGYELEDGAEVGADKDRMRQALESDEDLLNAIVDTADLADETRAEDLEEAGKASAAGPATGPGSAAKSQRSGASSSGS